MKFKLYSSVCVGTPFENLDLDIMRSALANNAKFGITGFLYRNKTNYFQYFEGHEEYVDQLTANLIADRRHFSFQILTVGDVLTRRFANWSMGYSRHSDENDKSQFIRPSDPPTEILSHLLRESERQLADVSRS